MKALEATGEIGVAADETDGRSYRVHLTDLGRARLETFARDLAGSLRARLSNWTEKDLKTLTGLLERLLDDARTDDPVAAPGPRHWWREKR